MVYNMAPFPYPKIVELREKFTYNIHPFANNLSPEKKAKVSKKMKEGYISSDDEDDDINQMTVGCLGLLSPQAGLDGSNEKVRATSTFSKNCEEQKNVTLESGKKEKKRRSPVEVSALQKQYDRTRKMQQQAVVVFSQSSSPKSQDLRDIPPAINHLFVVTRARKNKWKEQLQKERQQEKLRPVREEEEEKENLNEHLNDATEHLVELFKGESDANEASSPTQEQSSQDSGHLADKRLSCNVDISPPKTTDLFNHNASQNNSKTSKDYSRRKPGKTSLSISPVDSSIVLPDKKCIYPAKFTPFPGSRIKLSKKGLLYNKRTECEGNPKREAFLSGPPLPPSGKDESIRKGIYS